MSSTARFGAPCTLAPRNPNGTTDGKQNTCGAYLCIDGRCRSCVEDGECEIEYGAPTCGHLLDTRWPGNRCGNYSNAGASPAIRRQDPPTIATKPPARLTVEVVRTYPHSQQAHTEGLLFHDGELWESTGTVGDSQLRRLALGTGEEVAAVRLDQDLFGEGLARDGDRLVQLTFSSGRALLWSMKTLERVGEFAYEGEGWGLCHDGKSFVMSNGTSSLQIRDSETFALKHQVDVRTTGTLPFRFLRLNELECVDGEVLANVFEYRELVRIDLASGEITAIIDTRNLLRHADVSSDAIDGALDLNGIAYVPESQHYLLTGKSWPRIFEVRFVDDPLFR
ncbi:MAG: glutaminyl-peptide cyclotransferase [Myxococcales bacterium]|nr:glutaminyl-peptide cyclotransferase [Myxococcales bacterium]